RRADAPRQPVRVPALLGLAERPDQRSRVPAAIRRLQSHPPSPSLGTHTQGAAGGYAGRMKLGYAVGYWKQGPPPGALKAIRTAERLGYESVWTAEAYGSDAFTPLAWWGARTSRVKLGTAVAQLSARTPTAAAMAALTLDHLSEGRAILGLGVSGPQVVEGWYGQPFPQPLARTREYVAIIRDVLARDNAVEAPGPHYPLPLTGEHTTGLGKALKATVHPLRTDLPVYLAAEGPKNIALTAEIADGW